MLINFGCYYLIASKMFSDESHFQNSPPFTDGVHLKCKILLTVTDGEGVSPSVTVNGILRYKWTPSARGPSENEVIWKRFIGITFREPVMLKLPFRWFLLTRSIMVARNIIGIFSMQKYKNSIVYDLHKN